MFALLLLACGSPCDPGPDPAFEVGLGVDAFHPAADGDVADIVYGPQGGYHLDLALEGSHFDGSQVASGELIGTIDGERVAGAFPWFTFECDPERTAQQVWGIRLIFDAEPAELDGRTVQVDAEVTDARGSSATATRSLLVRDPL
jgi:hypothetical protein